MVIFQEPKINRTKRTVTLSPAAVLALKSHKDTQKAHCALLGESLTDEDLVFSNLTGGPRLPNTVSHAFSKITGKAGLKIRFHDLRDSHISMLITQRVHEKTISDPRGIRPLTLPWIFTDA